MANSVLAKMAVQISGNTAQFNKSMADASKSMDKFGKQAKQTETFATKLGGSIVALASGVGLAALGKQIFDVTAEFQKLGAVLTNTLGSAELAQAAFSDIREFASKTPFSVKELTASFVKLANQGFKPTLDQLRRLGDIASSQGKSFDQLTEAIIDAQTGEFERLKEFGIRASKEGDKVTFTFKGVKEQVDFTNESIRNYILSLGDAQGVTGSMAAISQTLSGQVSNLGDSFDNLFSGLGNASTGILSYILTQLSSAVNFVAEIVNDANQLRDPFGVERSQNVKEEFEAFQKLTKSGQAQAINEMAQEVQRWRNNLDELTRAFAVNEEAGLTAQQKLEKASKILGLSVEDTFDIFKKYNYELEITKSHVKETEELFKLFTAEYTKSTKAITQQTAAIKANNAATETKSGKNPLVPELDPVGGGIDGLISSLSADNLAKINSIIPNLQVIRKEFQDLGQEFIDISGLVAGGISDIADAFGRAAVGGKDFGKSLLDAAASFSQQFGALLIANGVALKAFQSGNPYVMIAAGAALVAIGGAIKQTLANRSNIGSGGSRSGSGSFLRGDVDRGYQDLALSTSVSGTDLNIVIGNTNIKDSFTKPQWR